MDRDGKQPTRRAREARKFLSLTDNCTENDCVYLELSELHTCSGERGRSQDDSHQTIPPPGRNDCKARTISKVPLASIATTTSHKARVRDEPARYVRNDTGERKIGGGEETRKGT